MDHEQHRSEEYPLQCWKTWMLSLASCSTDGQSPATDNLLVIISTDHVSILIFGPSLFSIDAPSALSIDSFTQSTVTCLPRARPGIKMLRQRPRRGQALMCFSRAPWTALPPPLLSWALQKWVALVPLLLLIFLVMSPSP